MKILSKQSDTKFFWIILFIIVYGFKIIGLAPFSLETSNEMSVGNSRKSCPARVLRFSKIGLSYNILLLILLQVIAAILYPNLHSMTYTNSSYITQAIDLALGLFVLFTIDIIIIYSTFRQDNAVCMINRLLEIHHLVSDIEKQPLSNEKTFLFFTAHIIFKFSLWITLGMTTPVQEAGDLSVTLLFVMTLDFIVYWFVVKYSMVVGFLARTFEQVNKNLINFDEFSNYLFHTSSGKTYLSVLSLSTHSSQLTNLQLLYSIRTMLSDVSQDVADFFSFPILLSIAYFFCNFIFNAYYLIFPLFVPSSAFSLNVIIYTILYIYLSTYPPTKLSFNVTKAQHEAQLTGRIVHKLLATPMRQEIEAKLKQFSLQLLHENINFTACGFFSLDCTMLNSMLAAAATYLVILIQFQQTLVGNTSNNTSSVESESV